MTSLKLIYARHLFLKGCEKDNVKLVRKAFDLAKNQDSNILNWVTPSKKSFLMIAAEYNSFKVVDYMIKNGVNLKPISFAGINALDGQNALDRAIFKKSWESAALLKEAGLNVHTVHLKIPKSPDLSCLHRFSMGLRQDWEERLEEAIILIHRGKLSEAIPADSTSPMSKIKDRIKPRL